MRAMKIKGLQKCSMVDYPGKISAVVFTPGCNMNCHYCHNRALLSEDADRGLTAPGEVEAFLARRSGVLDGVVITGGEPTLQSGLREFIERVREFGYPVKLDTNGTRPGVLLELIDEGLVDYVAMDVKAPWQRYEEICGTSVDLDAIDESIDLLLEGRVEYEFRTTFSPMLSGLDVMQLAQRVHGAQRLVLQQYRDPARYYGIQGPQPSFTAYTPEFIHNVAEEVRQIAAIPCMTRGLA